MIRGQHYPQDPYGREDRYSEPQPMRVDDKDQESLFGNFTK